MLLSRLAAWLAGTEIYQPPAGGDATPAADVELSRACFDSRRVRAGDLYCALPGAKVDGSRYAGEALARGAAAVLHGAARPELAAPQLVAAGGAEVLARVSGQAAAWLAGRPSDRLWVAAVTGTNGKTTVVHLLHQALERLGIPAARSGTLGFACAGRTEPTLNTTPAADVLQEWMKAALERGARAFVLEASSHGLAQERLAGTEVDAAAWTNLSHDHLDYHRDLDDYAAAKARLILQLDPARCALLPAGDQRVARACQGAQARLLRWGLDASAAAAEVRGACRESTSGVELEVEGELGRGRVRSALIGRHNAENLLLAFALLRLAGAEAAAAAAALSSAQGAPGRLQRVAAEAPWFLYVDYAHTPQALERALAALRRAHPGRRLGIVFGAGGDRDPHKREPMGRAAAAGADWCLVTSDNPRSEEPEAIVGAVARGARAVSSAVEVEVERRAAIRAAVAALAPGEVLLVAGKGHEDYQEIRGRRYPFDDCRELAEAARCRV